MGVVHRMYLFLVTVHVRASSSHMCVQAQATRLEVTGTGEIRKYEQSTRAGSKPMLSSVSLSPAIKYCLEMLYCEYLFGVFKGRK
jgi:hypothetical protein